MSLFGGPKTKSKETRGQRLSEVVHHGSKNGSCEGCVHFLRMIVKEKHHSYTQSACAYPNYGEYVKEGKPLNTDGTKTPKWCPINNSEGW